MKSVRTAAVAFPAGLLLTGATASNYTPFDDVQRRHPCRERSVEPSTDGPRE